MRPLRVTKCLLIKYFRIPVTHQKCIQHEVAENNIQYIDDADPFCPGETRSAQVCVCINL